MTYWIIKVNVADLRWFIYPIPTLLIRLSSNTFTGCNLFTLVFAEHFLRLLQARLEKEEIEEELKELQEKASTMKKQIPDPSHTQALNQVV